MTLTKKNKVYFFESQIPMGNVVYLPFVSGILQAYAQTFPIINEFYEFMPFIFIRDTPENMIKDMSDPFIVAFSVCIWNHQLSLTCAKLVRDRHPNSKIIFGGPQITSADKQYCDYIIKEEGEKKFVELLRDFIGEEVALKGFKEHNLNDYPSPYTQGLYEKTISDYPLLNFQAIVETNRGCPFTCSFCYWGQGFEEKKVRHHNLEYVRAEADWIGRNKIKYIFMADANFGMYERDQEVAKIYAQTKEKYGYPEKVRVCYGKNKEENVFKTAEILHKADLAKAITLARQSSNDMALLSINRKNINLDVYRRLQQRYHDSGMATYTELILGLPGETLESFKKGIDEVVNTETKLFVYHCTVLPNTEMCEPSYINKYGIKTVRVPMSEIHAEPRKEGMIVEYEDIIIETNTMSIHEWQEGAVYAWCAQLKNVFGVTDIPQGEINRFWQISENITNGYSRGQLDIRFGNIYWEPEEISYLRICLFNGIEGDLVQFARENVLWGRKDRKKERV